MKFKIFSLLVILFSGISAYAQEKVCFNKRNDKVTVRSQCLGSERVGSTKVMTKEFFGATIPKGTVLRGALAIDTHAPASGDFRTITSFPLPLSTPLTSDDDILVADNAEMQGTCNGGNCIASNDLNLSSVCTGTIDNPTAPAGKVCIYPISTGSNTLKGSVEGYRMDDHDERFGFHVGLNSVGEGDLYFSAVWAYTAP